ncbi:MAG: MarR family transcriptional regulator [Nitrososphaeraceae archaeon]|jgi:DNA-binding MarR family transcriptional regulator
MSDEFVANCFKMVHLMREKFEIDDKIYVEGISESYYHILDILNYVGSISVTELALYIGISQPSCSRSIKKMIENGWINKVEFQEDKRVLNISLTELGKDIVKENNRLMNETILKKIECHNKESINAINEDIIEIIKKLKTLRTY